MQTLDLEIARGDAVAGIKSGLLRLKWLAAAARFEFALRQHNWALKAGFNPNQPRVTAGNPAGGQWTDGNGGETDARSGGKLPRGETPEPRIRLAGDIPTGDSPEIPKNRPPGSGQRTAVLKLLGRFGPAAEAVYHAVSWVREYRAKIESYGDPELQDAVSEPKAGYQIHHIVEQTQARRGGYSRELIDGRDNLVRIPTMKHEDINGWYQRGNDDYGGQSPREYLREKSWDERRSVGLKALIDAKVLKP